MRCWTEKEEEKKTFIHPPTHPPTYLPMQAREAGFWSDSAIFLPLSSIHQSTHPPTFPIQNKGA